MTFGPLRSALFVSLILSIGLFLWGCNEGGGGRGEPSNVVNIGFDGGTGDCVQQLFPSNEPDISPLSPPIFLLTRTSQNTVGQAQANPGTPIPAEVTVNRATRRVRVELANAWAPDTVIFVDEVETTGNETIPMELSSSQQTVGRYFMRLTLCGLDCDEREVVFNLVPCTDDPDAGPCGIRAPYERTVIENGQVARVDGTCIDLGTTPDVGSGTVIIQ